MTIIAYKDPDHEGNSSKYWTGKPCIEKGCTNPAGTWWSPYWCFPCNVERMDRLDGQFEQIKKEFLNVESGTSDQRSPETD